MASSISATEPGLSLSVCAGTGGAHQIHGSAQAARIKLKVVVHQTLPISRSTRTSEPPRRCGAALSGFD